MYIYIHILIIIVLSYLIVISVFVAGFFSGICAGCGARGVGCGVLVVELQVEILDKEAGEARVAQKALQRYLENLVD
jgi:hypothetical protein